MDLFGVRVPDFSKALGSSMVLRFGRPKKVLNPTDSQKSGILDGKWIRDATDEAKFYFASAHSSGKIGVHSCSIPNDSRYASEDLEIPLDIKSAGQSESLPSDNLPPLCLALSWDSDYIEKSARIVSSYSDGRVAIHDVEKLDDGKLELLEIESWVGHEMFTVASEVWSAAFVGGKGTQLVMSGGDDVTLKLWDLRATARPIQVLKHFDAGVTVIAPHPRRPNLVACGSYDETIACYDIRMPARPVGHSGPLGGGIWRIKWHPYDDNRMLVAAMHGGCRIVQVDESDDDTIVMTATKEFTEHKSMAYGADWLVCNHPNEEEGYFEAAASCSFYDRAVYLWDTVA